MFVLRPLATPTLAPLRVTLAIALQREVWVAARPLLKGSVVDCSVVMRERRNIQNMPPAPLSGPCNIPLQHVVVRNIGAHDVLRSMDIGIPPAVAAGTPVNVTTAVGGIMVTARAVALTDGMVGDRIEVRLQRPARVRRIRITGPDAGLLTDGT
jgi:flagella basal body P-ring formation protein FlgA